jgi:DNA-binding NtrC family response regulator
MFQKPVLHSRILLIGLEPQLSAELELLLSSDGHLVHQSISFDAKCVHLRRDPADLIFCSSKAECFEPLQQFIQRHRPGLPIVVVSRHPEVSEWLDAMENGAADYCAAPFEASQIRWILESNRLNRHSAVSPWERHDVLEERLKVA